MDNNNDVLADWSLITGRGATKREEGNVKFNPPKGEAGKVLVMVKVGGGGVTTVAPKYNFCSLHPFLCSPHPFFCSLHHLFSSPHPFFCSLHHLFSSPHLLFSSPHPDTRQKDIHNITS